MRNRIDLVRLLAIARKEIIQLRRDRRSLALAFLLPLLLLIIFGYAIRFDIDALPLAVIDYDPGVETTRLIDAFAGSGYFDIVATPERYAAADSLLDLGTVQAVLVIPAEFRDDLHSERQATLQFLLDGSDANTATIALNYADAIVARFGRDVALRARAGNRALPDRGSAADPEMAPVTPQIRVWYNPTLRSRNMIVPGLIAVIMSIIAAMLTALTIAREWERGTMEQLVATPVSRLDVVLGKLVPYILIGFIDVAVATLLGVAVFDVPLRGDILLLAGMTLLFLVGALGLGIFISAILRSQVLAMQAAIIATYLPALLLSGFMFDIAAMPTALRVFTYIVPARYFIAVTRGIFLKGVGVEVLWVQGAFMVGFAVIGLSLATGAFRKRIA